MGNWNPGGRGERERTPNTFEEIIAEIVSKFDDNYKLSPPKKLNELQAQETREKLSESPSLSNCSKPVIKRTS